MDSITHTFTGAVIGRAIGGEKLGHWGTIAGAAMGLFPDSDFVLGLFSRQSHLEYHRAFTHSLLLLPCYALLFSWVFVKLSGQRDLWSYYKICFFALASHVLLDLFTSYGTMVLSPLSNYRFAWDLTFIVDLIFSGLILVPWFMSLLWKKKARRICRGSLGLVILYIVFLGIQHHRAVDVAKRFAAHLNEEVSEVAALPQPLSPFRWANYIETKDRVYQGYVDLLRKEPSLGLDREDQGTDPSFFLGRWLVTKDLYQPSTAMTYSSWPKRDDSPWVDKALATEGAKFYYWFARFPIARLVESGRGAHRVELTDVRFLLPRVRPPFVYYMEFDDSGKILSEGFAGGRQRFRMGRRSES